jgi:hypothetical protein
MKHRLTFIGAAIAVAAMCHAAAASGGKPARCSTTDDGVFACQFRMTDGQGSFEISAPGKPTYVMYIDEPGVAFGFVNLGAENVALPGRFLRSETDGACWKNDATDAEICAW